MGRRARSLWVPMRVDNTPKRSWPLRLLYYLRALLGAAPLSNPRPNLTAQWLDPARKAESVDDSAAWMSWIEVCAAYARTGVPMDTDAAQALPQQRAQDGTLRYEREGVLNLLSEAKEAVSDG